MNTPVFQQIADAIAAQLEQGVRPWSQPWTDSAGNACAGGLPINLKGRAYRGANAFWLDMAAKSRGYSAPVWMTFNQAKEAGGSVKKGEKGTAVFFWKFSTFEDKKTGEEKSSVMVRTYIVFNVDQTEGVKVPTQRVKTLAERVEAADALADATGVKIAWGGSRAFYSPAFDSVQMPARHSFKDADGLYGTLFHEIGHWTSHADRCNRELGKRFGDDAYAFEELVAELTAAFVCGSQGFTAPAREDHAAYIGSWLKVLKSDPRAFITAASAAQKAADFILGFAAAADEVEPEDMAEAA